MWRRRTRSPIGRRHSGNCLDRSGNSKVFRTRMIPRLRTDRRGRSDIGTQTLREMLGGSLDNGGHLHLQDGGEGNSTMGDLDTRHRHPSLDFTASNLARCEEEAVVLGVPVSEAATSPLQLHNNQGSCIMEPQTFNCFSLCELPEREVGTP